MIGLELPDNLIEMKKNMNNLAKDVLRPIARKYDEQEHVYPKELDVFRGMTGAMGGGAKKDKGSGEKKAPPPEGVIGQNMNVMIAVEEMGWGDCGLMLTFPGAGLGNAAIDAVATEEQLERFGKKWAAMAITEAGSGSDSGSITTTAKLEGDEWVLNGEKIFVTCADRCEVVVVWATVDRSAGKAGIKSFVVEKGTPGFELDHLEDKLGMRASDTGTMVLNDCRIPKNNILGSAEVVQSKSTAGFKGVMKTFDNTRPMVGIMATGVARAGVDLTREKMKENGIALDYNENVNNISSMQREFYLMEANLEAMRLLAWRAAWMADNKLANSLEASMCKAKGGRDGTRITHKCCELLGPMGFSQKELAEKWMRDCKILDIFEGTGQIQHLVVARNVLGLSSKELK
ncbi:MAG: acyl-CoA dehydrogenase family protein [Spirochaetota bacterium]|nr:acyl-CoA dehydrogenase family protein [Spirochaetota bacterium]